MKQQKSALKFEIFVTKWKTQQYKQLHLNDYKQDGRLAPAYFSPYCKYFDQLLQTVKNKTTVLIIVFKEFLQTSMPPLISVLYVKGYHDYPLKHFCLIRVPNHFVEEPFCLSENFWFRKILWMRGGGGGGGGSVTIFRRKFVVSQCQKISLRNPSVLCFRTFPVAKIWIRGGGGVSRFSVENFLSHRTEKFRGGTL